MYMLTKHRTETLILYRTARECEVEVVSRMYNRGWNYI